MLKGFSGYLQTDGYSAYNAVESVTRVGRWAHARRKWVDCFEGKKPVEGSQSEKAFAYGEKLFALEACWRDMSPDERQKHRMAEMKPVMDAYWDFLSSFLLKKIRICKRHKHTRYTRENSWRLFCWMEDWNLRTMWRSEPLSRLLWPEEISYSATPPKAQMSVPCAST